MSCERTRALATLSPLAAIRVPPSVWLDEDAAPIRAASAAEAITAHEARLGLSFEIMAESLALLALRPAASILWSMFKRSHADTRFRKPRELALNDAPAVVLGTDHKGGFLLWLPEATEDEDMSDEDTLHRAIDLMQAEAEKIVTERGGSAAGHYQQHRENFDAQHIEHHRKIVAAGTLDAAQDAIDAKDAHQHDYAAFLAGRLGEYHQRTGDLERAGEYMEVHDTHTAKAAELREGRAPEPSPDDDPDKPNNKGPAPDFAESAFVLLERGATGAQETTMSAHLFTDRAQAVEAAQGFPMSQEDAGRQGLTTWAEVHPVTPQFAANFAEMEQAGRLETTAALYSSAREIDGQLMPADPREPGAVNGQLREQADEAERKLSGGDGKDWKADLAQTIRPDVASTPSGTETITATQSKNRAEDEPATPQDIPTPLRPDERRALEAARPLAPEDHAAALAERGRDEVAGAAVPLPEQAAPVEREPNRYAVLKADTSEAREQMAENLGVVAESRDLDGGAPAAREILTRSNEESTKRQTAELAEAHGQDAAAERPMTARERHAARIAEARAEVTERAEREGSEPTQERNGGRDAGGMGMM